MDIHESHEQERSNRRFSLKTIVGIALAILLLLILLRSISIDEVYNTLQTTDLSMLSLATVLNVLMLTLMAYRWYVLYGHKRSKLSYLTLLKASFIAIFFNNFLPSTIGGDAYRAYYVAKEDEEAGVTGALSVIFVDRIIGLIGLMLVSFSAVFLYQGEFLSAIGDIRIWILLIGLALIGFLWLGMNKSTYMLASNILQNIRIPKKDWLQNKLDIFERHLIVYSTQRQLLFYSLVLSVILRSIWLLSCYVLGQAFHFDVPILTYFVLIPIIEAIRMIPITIQGLGIREGLFVLFFTQFGLTTSEAAVLGVMVYLLLNVNGLIGFVLYIWDLMVSGSSKKENGEIEAEASTGSRS